MIYLRDANVRHCSVINKHLLCILHRFFLFVLLKMLYMAVKERLREFIKYKRISEREFCRQIGVSTSYVNSIRTSIQPDKMKSIGEVFPELDPMWLITGEGEMLKNTNISNNSGNGTSVAGNGNKVTNNDIAGMIELQKGYQAMIKEKDEQISRLISVIEKLSSK